jgi:transcription antitermination factor NusG
MSLEAVGLRVYLPREPVWRGRGPDKQKVYRPLLGGHLFVAFRRGENHFEAIRNANGVALILRDGPGLPPAEVPWRSIAIVQTVEGELEDDFARRAARKRRYGDDTSEFIEAVKAAPPDKRAEQILALLGRGNKARMKLETLREIA